MMTSKLERFYQDDSLVMLPSILKKSLSRLCFPLLSLISREQSLSLGLTPIDDERIIIALKYSRGKVLDIGCGANLFSRSYGNAYGIDIFPWQGIDTRADGASLPFASNTFDTVCFLATLNHIHEREQALHEAWRVLKPGGKVLVTMISPFLGAIIHRLRYIHDPDQKVRQMDHQQELLGISHEMIHTLLRSAGFFGITHYSFVMGLNRLYQGQKVSGDST